MLNEQLNIDRVAILLATYNGEKYIEEQLKSLKEQTFESYTVFISDDGSSDRTPEILRDCAKEDSRFIFIDGKRKGGVVNNFCYLIEYIKDMNYDYIMFCDQDDFWLPHKINSSLAYFKSKITKGPALLYTNLIVVDENLNIISNDFYKYIKSAPDNNLSSNFISWASTVYGCTVLFNRELLLFILDFPERIPMHDHWSAKCCIDNGQMIYFDEPTILYRQHGNNQVGAKNSSLCKRALNITKTLNKINRHAKDVLLMNGVNNFDIIQRLNLSYKIITFRGFGFFYRVILSLLILVVVL